MTLPKHLPAGTGKDPSRVAVAPYNFVELPDKVVEVKQEDLPKHDRYGNNPRITGRIECLLTTASPLYTRCGLTTKEFEQGVEAKDKPEFCYTDPNTLKPVILGSSLRGMLRSLIEIITYSKISQVSGQTRFFFRDVAGNPKHESLAKEYKEHVNKQTVKAGYLFQKQGKWYVRPAQFISHQQKKLPFIWIREKTVCAEIPEFVSVDRINYRPQYLTNVSFGDITFSKTQRCFANQISTQRDKYATQGTLLSSGNMLESGDGQIQSPRKNHCLVGGPDEQAELLEISEVAIAHYRQSLTDFQKEAPFSKEWGILQQGRCIFYCEPKRGKLVVLFGQSPNFRIAYSHQRNGEAASVKDFIPEFLRDSTILDCAEALFGFVPSNKQSLQALPGRVFVSDAECEQTATDDIWFSGNQNLPIVPKILSGPKPTTFQHYLVQSSLHRAELKHYANQPTAETVIRGHKLYWHQGKSPQIHHPNPEDAPELQRTQIKPIKPGIEFKFTIHFENLSAPELGALLWVLNLSQMTAEDEQTYRLSIGMGKPLGMGAIKVEPKQVYRSDRTARYSSLFNDSGWELAESKIEISSYLSQFENHMLVELGVVNEFNQINRIQSLLTMLSWQEQIQLPISDQRRYMEIERSVQKRHKIGRPTKPFDKTQNEYRERPVLPTPFQVVGKTPLDESSQLSERQIKIRRIANENCFTEGQILPVTVVAVKGIEITCQFPGGIKRKVKDKKQSSQVGDIIQAQIVELGEDKAPRKFRLLTNT